MVRLANDPANSADVPVANDIARQKKPPGNPGVGVHQNEVPTGLYLGERY
jgi:hypothetical protein